MLMTTCRLCSTVYLNFMHTKDLVFPVLICRHRQLNRPFQNLKDTNSTFFSLRHNRISGDLVGRCLRYLLSFRDLVHNDGYHCQLSTILFYKVIILGILILRPAMCKPVTLFSIYIMVAWKALIHGYRGIETPPGTCLLTLNVFQVRCHTKSLVKYTIKVSDCFHFFSQKSNFIQRASLG